MPSSVRFALTALLLPGALILPFACSSDPDATDGFGGATGAEDSGADAQPDALTGNDAVGDHAKPDGLPLNDATSENPPLDSGPDDAQVDAVVEATPDTNQDSSSDALEDAAEEIGPDAPDSTPDAPVGPVSPGVYEYTSLPAYGLVNPPAVAWHPSGTYALVLDTQDKVYQYDAASSSLSVVATTSSSTRWRDVVFAPDGTHAVLLANDASASEGRLFLWDHALASVTEMAAERFAGGTYEELAFGPNGDGVLLGAKSGYIAFVWDFDVATGRTNVRAVNTSAGCQGIDWATDAFDAPAPAIVCGVNGVDLLHIDGGGNFVKHTLNAGNTSRIAARPQGDYALAVCWSCHKIYRFQQGAWDTDFYSPFMPGAMQVEFSSDGARALILGGHGGSPVVGQVYEYRHDLYDESEFMDVSIPGFGSPPYNADTYVNLNDASWRPGCDGGLIVGGSNTWNSTTGYVIEFAVVNGVACSG